MPRSNPDRAAAVIIHDGAVLLIDREKRGDEHVVVPGGKVEAGETPEVACLREVREEVNLEVELLGLLGSFPDEGRTQWFYRARWVSGEVEFGHGPEVDRPGNRYAPRWYTADELDDIDLRPREAAKIIRRALADD